MGPPPLTPATRFLQNVAWSLPMGVTAPRPVTTARRERSDGGTGVGAPERCGAVILPGCVTLGVRVRVEGPRRPPCHPAVGASRGRHGAPVGWYDRRPGTHSAAEPGGGG